ncbi:MAG: ribosome silencing factor [Candidatus Lambdaproteobacteria bacterium]|nr:ribosome silencing factor [Candidatus Lambdaproteobacteria bacterium]
MQERAIAERIVRAAQETKAEDILLYDMQQRSAITDFIVICSGRSQAHVRGVADNIDLKLKKAGVRSLSVEGHTEGSWVLLDLDVVIVHVFHPETRAYYDLESLLEGYPCQRFATPEESAGSVQSAAMP